MNKVISGKQAPGFYEAILGKSTNEYMQDMNVIAGNLYRNRLDGMYYECMKSGSAQASPVAEFFRLEPVSLKSLNLYINHSTYETVPDLQHDMTLSLGRVVETLGYTTKNDGLGRKYIITATDVDNLGITVGSYFASKFEDEVSRAVGYTTNFTSATGTVVIPSGLPIGTRRLIRKVNATQGVVTISASGSEKITPALLNSVSLNSDGDFWLLEKVSATRWDLVEGEETGVNSSGSYWRFATGEQKCFVQPRVGAMTGTLYATGLYSYSSGTINLPKAFKDISYSSSPAYIETDTYKLLSSFAIPNTVSTYYTFYIGKTATAAQIFADFNLLGRWY